MEDPIKFDCGCVIGNDGELFIIIPCSLDCEKFKFCIEETRKQGKPIRVVKVSLDGYVA